MCKMILLLCKMTILITLQFIHIVCKLTQLFSSVKLVIENYIKTLF